MSAAGVVAVFFVAGAGAVVRDAAPVSAATLEQEGAPWPALCGTTGRTGERGKEYGRSECR